MMHGEGAVDRKGARELLLEVSLTAYIPRYLGICVRTMREG